jgi:spermidine/putrescine transport system permease protein
LPARGGDVSLTHYIFAMSEPSSPRPRWPSELRALEWGFGAWTALVFVFLYLPIAVLVVYSFNDSRLNITWEGFTLRWYGELFASRRILAALQNSLLIAAGVTVVAVVMGTGSAWLLHRHRYRFGRQIQTLVFLPMVMPEVIIGISLLVFFATMNIALGHMTVMLAHATFCFPFVFVAVQARLLGLDPALEEAALDLGATPAQAFRLVILPCLKPAVIAGAMMAFTLSMDELIVTYFTTGPNSRTMPLLVFEMARLGLNPMLNALSALFILTTLTSVLFMGYLRRLARRALPA